MRRRARDAAGPAQVSTLREESRAEYVGAGLATAFVGTIGLLEWHFLFLLARPMLAFVLVLSSLRHD